MTHSTEIDGIINEIVGGSTEFDDISNIIITGGRGNKHGVKRVVNHNVDYGIRKQFTQLKHASKTNVKQLLNIVDMSIPLSFNKTIFYDDNDSSPRKLSDSGVNQKIIKALKSKINEPINNFINYKVIELELSKIADLVIVELVVDLAKYIKNKKKDVNMRKIKIKNDVSMMLDDMDGSKYIANMFEVISITSINANMPSNLSEVVIHLLNMVNKTRPRMGIWDTNLVLDAPTYPTLDEKTMESIKVLREQSQSQSSIYDLVKTIVLINHKLLSHYKKIEQYHIDVAHGVQKIHNCLFKFLA